MIFSIFGKLFSLIFQLPVVKVLEYRIVSIEVHFIPSEMERTFIYEYFQLSYIHKIKKTF